MDRTTFEEIVRQALDDLPEEIARRLDNVEVVIEEAPSPGLLRSLGLDPRRDTLFGLYEGVPLSERSYDSSGHLPDKISIYYRPLVRSFRSPRRIRREVRDTIIHEVAHFFGFDDDEIEDLGY
jgi:predicted Zn-dependent protease with MMP-like domain